MFTSDERDCLEDVANAAKGAQDYVGTSSKEQFLLNRKDQDSVNYKFIVMGEAAGRLGRLGTNFHARHPNVPWSDMIGMRNILAHQYGRVDPEIVWEALKKTVPSVIDHLEPILRGPGNDEF